MFDSAKQIRYQKFLKNSNSELNQTKIERAMKFNEYYDTFKHFVLKDNKLYCRAFKVGQTKRLVMCDYSAADIIEKVYI